MKEAEILAASDDHHVELNHSRLTIGYLTPRIGDAVSQALWTGILDAAQEQNVNLIAFVGETLRDAVDGSSPANIVYDLVNTRTVHGLISWASSLSGSPERDQLQSFFRRYHPLPMVSITLPMENIPSVLIDSYQGMRGLIAHLVEVHGCRRLAFIRGPEGHYYAQERYRAYADALAGYGIPFDPRLVTTAAEFGLTTGVEGIRLLLDERNLRPQLDFEAVVTVSDLPALGALAELQTRGIKVPESVALVGFNDVLESRFVTPPLTSVRLPFYEQGRRAVEMLLALLTGASVPDQVVLPAKLKIRRSCGCQLPSLVRAAADPTLELAPSTLANALATRRGHILEALEQAGEAVAKGLAAKWAAQLLDSFADSLVSDPAAENAFLQQLDLVLRQTMLADAPVQDWQDVLSALRRAVLPCCGDADGKTLRRAENLWSQARVLVGEAALRARGHQMVQQSHQSKALRQISQALVTAFDVTELVDVLARDLPRLGIECCYLSLYEDPQNPTGRSRSILGCDARGRIEWKPDERSFPSDQLAPVDISDLHRPGRPYSWVVEPLYFREEPLGFALFEVGPKDGTIYEVLRGQISSSLKGALLLDETRQAQAAAEKADRLKTRLLANVSHELRTPLNVIIGCTREVLSTPTLHGTALPEELLKELAHIHHSAEHQLRVINDLLDLSRAEIGELDLYLEFLDPGSLLEDAFHSMAATASRSNVTWHLCLPNRLPTIRADPVRLRQILLNLLSNAAKFVEQGQVLLGAAVTPLHLHIWVQDTGPGIAPDMQERIFEPFITADHTNRRLQGAGLGLSITRRLVALHRGVMELESQPGQGSTFHVYLPLPTLNDRPGDRCAAVQPVLLLISSRRQPAVEIVEFSQRQGLAMQCLQSGDDLDAIMQNGRPVALAWDLADANPGDWQVIRRLRNHPRLCQAPFILYGQGSGKQTHLSIGMTNFVVKPMNGDTLMEAINSICPSADAGPILVVDDDPQILALYREIVTRGCPGYAICTAADGAAAVAHMAEMTPSLVILDLLMPEMDGFDVLDWMRHNGPTRRVPVLILSNRVLALDDIKRIEQHALVTLQSKGMLSTAELVASLHRILFGTDALPQHTSALVKRAVAYFHRNYNRSLSRWEIATAVDVSDDYLSRVFRQELGISPWEYLNRYRTLQAMERLRHTNDDIATVARQVGFKDPAYFSRVFRKVTGQSPTACREQSK
ncbi:MAG: substrate-binding domain-containing protein [Chloroflexota bacterium]